LEKVRGLITFASFSDDALRNAPTRLILAAMEVPARLLGIYVAAQAADLPQSVERVRALAGRGLEGDRYAAGMGTFSERPGRRDVTLIESETLEAYQRQSGQKLSAAEARRNLLTQGVRLNELVGREFQVGAVRLRGLRLSEPCTHLMRLTHPGTLRGLVHRGGLVAEVLCDGELAVGDKIEETGEERVTDGDAIRAPDES
jgi:MOSC domain-containing protein YiiM